MLSPPVQLADIPERLRALRVAAAEPSYAEIARRIGTERARRGRSGILSRATVYDCFRDGRRRFDAALVIDIVRVLSSDPAEPAAWAAALHALALSAEASALVSVSGALPDPVVPFVGRARELARLGATAGTYWIHAMGGSGKTSLARQAVHQAVSAGRATGVIVADLRGHSVAGPPADPHAVLRAALRLLGEKNPAIPAAQARRMLRERLRRERRLLLLDDAASPEQVEAIVPNPAGTAVIVTSRVADAASGFTPIALPPFAPYESLALLDAVAGREIVQRDTETAESLLALTDHLPLAVSLTAARVAEHGDWTLTEHLQRARRRRDGLRLDAPVAGSLELSVQQLSASAQRLLRALAPYPVEVLDREAIRSLTDLGADAADHAVDELVRHSLLSRTGDGRLEMHDLVRVHAQDMADEIDPPSLRIADAARLRANVVDRAWAARSVWERTQKVHRRAPRHQSGAVTVPDPEAFFTDGMDLLLHVALRMPDADVPSAINLIAETIGERLHIAGRLTEALVLQRQALRVARERGDALGEQRALVELGAALTLAGHSVEAQETLAAVDVNGAGWAHEAPLVHNSRLINLTYQGRSDEALAAFDAGVAAARAVSDLWREGLLCNNVALLHLRLGALDECRTALERSIAISAELDDAAGAARGRVNLARILLDLDDYSAAEDVSRQAIDEMEALGYRPGVVVARTNLGAALTGRGCFDEAVRVLEQGLDDARAAGMPQEDMWLNLGVALRSAGRIDEARRALIEGREHARRAGDTITAAECVGELEALGGEPTDGESPES